MTDPIADLLTRIRNAQIARNSFTTVPYSKLKLEISKKLEKEGFIEKVQENTNEDGFKELIIDIDPERETPLNLTRVSRPGQRIFKKAKDLKLVKNGLGMELVSTSKGLMTNTEAHLAQIGGEIICRIY